MAYTYRKELPESSLCTLFCLSWENRNTEVGKSEIWLHLLVPENTEDSKL